MVSYTDVRHKNIAGVEVIQMLSIKKLKTLKMLKTYVTKIYNDKK